MEKEKLLKTIERKELQRVLKLSKEMFTDEYCEWFSLSDEDIKNVHHLEKIKAYMDDFMEWKRLYSVEELKEFLKIIYK